ncbi:MAG: DUF3443 domain-containing protein [Ramlibacter sp.]
MTLLRTRLPHWLITLVAAFSLVACGGGGGGGTSGGSTPVTTSAIPAGAAVSSNVAAAPNVLPMVVDRGVNGNAINSPYVTVTVCRPGSQVCQDIDHVLVDTGSTGLRLTAAVAASLALPAVTTGAGETFGECAHFASGFTWGAVRRADIRLASLTASNAPVQVIGDADVPTVPSSCSGTGGSLQASGAAKGILGVGLFKQDCGVACELSTSPQIYFSCTTGGCVSSRIPMASQVTNPVSLLATDNNGVVLVLPAVPQGGVVSATGALILGIGTESNNQLGGATMFTTDTNGYFKTVYNGTTYSRSFLDSGSNGLFFHDTTLKACASSTDFFCPAGPLPLTATQVSASGVSRDVAFTIESVDPLASAVAAASIGGDAGEGLPQAFDWGLPFFYGRTVFTAITGASTPAGPGPYWAW